MSEPNNSQQAQTREDTQPPKPLSAGVLLKQARKEKGFLLETVHEATKIPLDVLKAIEEGYTVRNITPFYYKGFLKIYAQHLGVDISQVVQDYKKEELPKKYYKKIQTPTISVQDPLSQAMTRERMRRIVIGIGIILALFVVVKFFGWVKNRKTDAPRVVKSRVKKESVKADKKPSKEKTKTADTKVAPKVEAKSEPKPEVKVEPAPEVKAEVGVEEGAVGGAGLSSSENGQSSSAKKIRLTVRAKKNGWLKVTSDGELVFQGTLDVGAVETWLADRKIEISGKNISQLEFELNGKMIGTLGRDDRRANKVVITKDGLSVTK